MEKEEFGKNLIQMTEHATEIGLSKVLKKIKKHLGKKLAKMSDQERLEYDIEQNKRVKAFCEKHNLPMSDRKAAKRINLETGEGLPEDAPFEEQFDFDEFDFEAIERRDTLSRAGLSSPKFDSKLFGSEVESLLVKYGHLKPGGNTSLKQRMEKEEREYKIITNMRSAHAKFMDEFNEALNKNGNENGS